MMHAADLLCLDVLQHLFDPRKSIYRALRDTEEATKRGTNELQQPQTVVYAQHLYENYYIGKVQIPSLLLCNLEIKIVCMARLSFMLHNKKLIENTAVFCSSACMPSWANTLCKMHKACQLDSTAYLLAVPCQAVLMLQADNTGPMVEPCSSTAQQHASDVAKLFQLSEHTKRKFSEYQEVLKCRQVVEKALKQVVLPGDYLVAHEQHRYPFSIIQVKKDVSAQDFTNNLEAEGVCSSCKPKAEKAFRTKRGDKLEFRLGKKEQQDVQTPSVSEERSSKRQRYVLPQFEDVKPANLLFCFQERRLSARSLCCPFGIEPSNKQNCNSSWCCFPPNLLSYSTCRPCCGTQHAFMRN